MKLEPIRKGEKQIMEILWDADKPLTSLEITEQMGSAMCVGNLHRVLQKLEKKGYITMCGAERTSKHLIRQFVPAISREDYVTVVVKNEVTKNLERLLPRIGLSFVRSTQKNLTDEEREKLVEELRAMIAEYEQEEG